MFTIKSFDISYIFAVLLHSKISTIHLLSENNAAAISQRKLQLK